MRVPLRSIVETSRSRVRRATLSIRSIPVGLESSVEAIFVSIVRAWISGVSGRILPQYARPETVQDAGPAEAGAALSLTSEEVDRVLIYQTERLGRWVTRVGDWHGMEVIRATKSAVGVDVTPYIALNEVQSQIEAGIREGTSRLRSVNADTRRRVEALVMRAFSDRWTKKRLTDELASMLDSTKKRARLRARDFSSMLQSVLDEYRFIQFGLMEYIWRTREDERVRSTHESRNGRAFKWSDPPYDGHAGRPPGCRCKPEALLWR